MDPTVEFFRRIVGPDVAVAVTVIGGVFTWLRSGLPLEAFPVTQMPAGAWVSILIATCVVAIVWPAYVLNRTETSVRIYATSLDEVRSLIPKRHNRWLRRGNLLVLSGLIGMTVGGWWLIHSSSAKTVAFSADLETSAQSAFQWIAKEGDTRVWRVRPGVLKPVPAWDCYQWRISDRPRLNKIRVIFNEMKFDLPRRLENTDEESRVAPGGWRCVSAQKDIVKLANGSTMENNVCMGVYEIDVGRELDSKMSIPGLPLAVLEGPASDGRDGPSKVGVEIEIETTCPLLSRGKAIVQTPEEELLYVVRGSE